MPSTPQVKFNLINNNVEESYPLQGISVVLARTTKGPFNDPSKVISTITQFESVFGKEIVPDNSVSNIEKALKGGSKLRIIRVEGNGATQGNLETLFQVTIDQESVDIKAKTRGKGDPIGSGENFTVNLFKSGNTIYYKIIDNNGTDVLDEGSIFTYMQADSVNKTSVDYLAFSNFIENNPCLEISVSSEGDIKSVEDLLQRMAEIDGTKKTFSTNVTEDAKTPKSISGSIGSAGTDPTVAEWKASVDYIRDHIDAYNILASHVYGHLKESDSEVTQVYGAIKDILDEIEEFRLFIEIPKSKKTSEEMINWKKTISQGIGHSKWVSYYAGGIQYANNYGITVDSEVGGTVLGLADASATNKGYDKSFAGLNRGLVPEALGVVSANYGSPGRIGNMEELAQQAINIFCIKDTPTYGKRVVLWHNFTDQVKQDSFRFLGNTGLVLNIKKTLRPILENYIEEPNFWGTWKSIYLRVKPIIDSWVDDGALTDPEWYGDQNASSWGDLQINTEAEARQGHYKARFSFKDIVALQDITLDVVIESSTKTVDISIVDNS